MRGESSAETARLHRLERLRTQLLSDENTLSEITRQWPATDLQHLRQLRRNALKEQENNKPPKNYRGHLSISEGTGRRPPTATANQPEDSGNSE